MAAEVFVDTQYLIASIDRLDPWSRAARDARSQLRVMRLVTSEFVLVEFLGFVCESGPFLRHEAAVLADRIRSDSTVTVEPAGSVLFETALRLYEARPDKGYSLVDSTSMVIMRERGIEGVLSADRHFEQEGFRALLRS